MALNIKRRETEILARQYAQRTGKSVTMAVEQALRDGLDRLKPDAAEIARRRAALRAVLDGLPPFRPGVTMQQIDDEMYDEHGLPR